MITSDIVCFTTSTLTRTACGGILLQGSDHGWAGSFEWWFPAQRPFWSLTDGWSKPFFSIYPAPDSAYASSFLYFWTLLHSPVSPYQFCPFPINFLTGKQISSFLVFCPISCFLFCYPPISSSLFLSTSLLMMPSFKRLHHVPAVVCGHTPSISSKPGKLNLFKTFRNLVIYFLWMEEVEKYCFCLNGYQIADNWIFRFPSEMLTNE